MVVVLEAREQLCHELRAAAAAAVVSAVTQLQPEGLLSDELLYGRRGEHAPLVHRLDRNRRSRARHHTGGPDLTEATLAHYAS